MAPVRQMTSDLAEKRDPLRPLGQELRNQDRGRRVIASFGWKRFDVAVMKIAAIQQTLPAQLVPADLQHGLGRIQRSETPARVLLRQGQNFRARSSTHAQYSAVIGQVQEGNLR